MCNNSGRQSAVSSRQSADYGLSTAGCPLPTANCLRITALLALLLLPGAAHAADLPCAKCHPAETAGFLATQMGRSSGLAADAPSGSYYHAVSKTQFTIDVTGGTGAPNGKMVQRIERDGIHGEYDVAFAIGSGTHAFAYVVDIGGHLFESPIGYFPGRGWGMSPGYEEQKTPDFDRPVTEDCLFCHTGRALPVAGTYNTFQDPPLAAAGITCDRCHGPSEAHLKNPVPGSIINPANLPERARNSVCEQCHLAGEERVSNPGKQVADFLPGEKLEDIYSVYVRADSLDPTRPGAFKVVSQAQQLALSMCARKSQGKLWCGTCHDPHVQPKDPTSYFRDRCLSCHGPALLKTHPKPNQDCIGCHMPRRPVTDGAHTVFTDHRITRRPPPASSTAMAANSPDANLALAARRIVPGGRTGPAQPGTGRSQGGRPARELPAHQSGLSTADAVLVRLRQRSRAAQWPRHRRAGRESRHGGCGDVRAGDPARARVRCR